MPGKLMVFKTKKGKRVIAPRDMTPEEIADAIAKEIMKDSADPNVFIPPKVRTTQKREHQALLKS